jgi:lysophospholipase L1-like esterase
VLLLSLAVSMALAEIVVRAWVGVPMAERLPILMMRANSHRGWQMVPGLEHYTYQHRVHVNALGLRGPEVGAKRPHELRVLVLGDSLVYGQGVGDDETLPVALEEALARRAPQRPWSVVNSGHRAYDTVQEVALLEELGPSIEPNAAVLCWFWNDLHERDIAQTFQRLEGKGELAFDTGNRVEGLDRLRWYGWQLLRHSALFMWLHDVKGAMVEPLEREYVENGLRRLGRHLERFRAACTELRCTPYFVIVPDSSALRGPGEAQSISEAAAGVARARGLPVIELLPALVPLYAESGELPILPYDGHYVPEANRAMGEHLAERLLALGLGAGDE